MILADFQIVNLCLTGMVTPFDSLLVNPASLDVRLGDELLIECATVPELVSFDISSHTEEKPYKLLPGQSILAPTLETFCLPSDVAAQFMLKSSRAREGLQHLMAGYCDPGWTGSVLTMELQNSRQFHPVNLWPGKRIGQMIFHQMSAVPRLSYQETGRYNGDRTVAASKG